METVLITGASRGIGLALTRKFLELNYNVIATYREQPSSELSALTSLPRLSLFDLQVTNPESIANLASDLSNLTLDILINNAGVIGPEKQDFHSLEPQAWADTFAVNTIAPLMMCRAFLDHLKHSPLPRIITISSQMGALQLEGDGLYAYRSSKAAVNKVMQVLAGELKAQGVIVCPVHPGWVKTDMGGSNADITVSESASGIVELVRNLSLEQTGKFFTWQGREHVW